MGRAEDDARAKRAAERGREERQEVEREASERSESVRREAQLAEDRVAASCSPWSFFISDGSIATSFTLSALAIGTCGMMLFDTQDRNDAELGLAIAVPTIVLVVLFFLFARSRVRAAWRLEKQWMAQLPFRVDKLGDGVGSTSGHRLVVRIRFREAPHNLPFDEARALMAHVDPGGEVSRSDKMLELRARVAGEPEGDAARVKGRRLLFHDLVDGVLLPLSQTHPIELIELDD
jgi:hypothetical protein